MTTFQSLTPAALYRHCDPTKFTFTTTADLHDSDTIIGQPRAVEAIRFGVGIQHHQIHIESLGQIYSGISTVSLQPEPVPLHVKIILLGERLLYYLLCHYDPDFMELFKVAADFEDNMVRDDDNDLAYAHLIAGLAQKESLRPFTTTAVARIIEHSARLAQDAARLTTHMQSISDLLREADFWAGEARHEVVTAVDIQHALDAQIYRASRIRERVQENILRQTILIDTEGTVVGQVNGLSVISLGSYAFG